jgi:uncharacterized protein YaaW (UPF0174 family)
MKKTMIMALAILGIIGTVITIFILVMGDGINQFQLTVNNGEGTGSYKKGTVIEVVAQKAQKGYRFYKWTGDIQFLSDPNAQKTSLKMPNSNASITATFMDSLAPFVQIKQKWSPNNFDDFLVHCSLTRMNSIRKSIALPEVERLNINCLNEVKEQFIWKSSNIATYPFKDKEKIDYHSIVKWVAGKYGVKNDYINNDTTFVLERRILEKVFTDIWDKLTPNQRKELLSKIDKNGTLDIASISTLSGGAALAALATTTYFAGFAFYTTMSTVMCTVAGFFGVTLPFAAYTGTASLAAFLSGPIGWAIIATAVGAGVLLLGRADYQETSAFIIQMHMIKVSAYKNSHWDIPIINRH